MAAPADKAPATFLDYRAMAMADVPEPGSVAPDSASRPRSRSPAAAATAASSSSIPEQHRLPLSLRAGPRSPRMTTTMQQEMHAPANGAPKIMRSAPTGSPLSAQEPAEFPFHSPPSSQHNGAPAPAPAPAAAPIDKADAVDAVDHAAAAAPRAPKSSSSAANGTTSSYYPPFAPVSRIPTAEGELVDANMPKERKSVQFARTATYGSDIPGPGSRQQSWEVDEGKGKGKSKATTDDELQRPCRSIRPL